MSPRIVHIPLSGGDRKHLAKQLRLAGGAYDELMRQAATAREEAAAKLRLAERLECDAWNALMFCGGPAAPSPAIGAAIEAGYYLLEARCNRCQKFNYVDLRELKRPPATPVHVLEAALFCRECSEGKSWKQRAHLICLTCHMPPSPEAPRARGRR